MIINQGKQNIIFKYKTELKASNLSKLIGGFSSAGLCDINFTSSSSQLTIRDYSLLVKPAKYYVGSTGEHYLDAVISDANQHLFKVTGSDVVFSGIGVDIEDDDFLVVTYDYHFSSTPSGPVENSYGEFSLLTSQQCHDKFIRDKTSNENSIIVLIGIREEGSSSYYWTTNGADWSDIALEEKGFDCKRWLSRISPKREEFIMNKFVISHYLEVRCHNDLYRCNVVTSDGNFRTGNPLITSLSGDMENMYYLVYIKDYYLEYRRSNLPLNPNYEYVGCIRLTDITKPYLGDIEPIRQSHKDLDGITKIVVSTETPENNDDNHIDYGNSMKITFVTK